VNFLKVYVCNWMGNGLSGVNVTIFGRATNWTYVGSTEPDGYLTVQAGRGIYDIWAQVGPNLLRAAIFHDGTEGTVNLQQSAMVIVGDFLQWNPILLPNWLWLLIIAVVIIAAWYIFKKSA
jgi:hypothetical protein